MADYNDLLKLEKKPKQPPLSVSSPLPTQQPLQKPDADKHVNLQAGKQVSMQTGKPANLQTICMQTCKQVNMQSRRNILLIS